MTCKKCSKEITESESIEGHCADCFVSMAQGIRALSSEERTRLKKMVAQEMAGLLPRDALRDLLEEGCDRILMGKVDTDEELNRMINSIERMSGLAMLREIMNVISALRTTLEEQEEELRSKIKRLGSL